MEEIDQKPPQFHEMNLDDRILKAIAKLGWCEPTLIQQKAIPFILDGKDVLAKGRTGSGKTGAFAIPVIQKILDGKPSIVEALPDVKHVVLIESDEEELLKGIFCHITPKRHIKLSKSHPITVKSMYIVSKMCHERELN